MNRIISKHKVNYPTSVYSVKIYGYYGDMDIVIDSLTDHMSYERAIALYDTADGIQKNKMQTMDEFESWRKKNGVAENDDFPWDYVHFEDFCPKIKFVEMYYFNEYGQEFICEIESMEC